MAKGGMTTSCTQRPKQHALCTAQPADMRSGAQLRRNGSRVARSATISTTRHQTALGARLHRWAASRKRSSACVSPIDFRWDVQAGPTEPAGGRGCQGESSGRAGLPVKVWP